MEEILLHLEKFAAAYCILGATIGFVLKVYFVDLKGNTKSLSYLKTRVTKLEKEMEDNTKNDLAVKTNIEKELALINRRFDHNNIVLEMIADKAGVRKLPKFEK